jgi:hypothetical protein
MMEDADLWNTENLQSAQTDRLKPVYDLVRSPVFLTLSAFYIFAMGVSVVAAFASN